MFGVPAGLTGGGGGTPQRIRPGSIRHPLHALREKAGDRGLASRAIEQQKERNRRNWSCLVIELCCQLA